MELLWLAVAAAGGAVVAYLLLRGGSARLDERLAAQQQARAQAEGALAETRAGLDRLRTELARAQTALEQERSAAAEKLQLLEATRDEMTLRFKQLSQDILEDKSRRFAEQNQQNLETILAPLRERIGSFEQQVKDSYERETRDRIALKEQIAQLQVLNQKVSAEANQLALALRGQSQVQGNWGEMMLERILELSGLERGREFETQFSAADAEGQRRRPDAVIHLPHGRDIIVDAKVSLTAYLRCAEAPDEPTRAAALKEHVASLRAHIRELSAKNYHELDGIASLDFVLMFVPSEAAYVEAVRAAPDLYEEALAHNIGMVGPSTLLPTLRTVENLWKVERQNRNAQKIAEAAGGLYDQLVLFEQALSDVGEALGRAQESYDTAHKRLSEGRGNLVRRAEQLKKMGAATSRQLPTPLADQADGPEEA